MLISCRQMLIKRKMHSVLELEQCSETERGCFLDLLRIWTLGVFSVDVENIN